MAAFFALLRGGDSLKLADEVYQLCLVVLSQPELEPIACACVVHRAARDLQGSQAPGSTDGDADLPLVREQICLARKRLVELPNRREEARQIAITKSS